MTKEKKKVFSEITRRKSKITNLRPLNYILNIYLYCNLSFPSFKINVSLNLMHIIQLDITIFYANQTMLHNNN